MTPAELDHLAHTLPKGRVKACTVADLAYDMCASDRYIREGLEQLVNERRIPVVTLPTNPGVFIAITPEEVDLADANLRSRAMAILHRRRSLRLCRERLAYSPTLFDL